MKNKSIAILLYSATILTISCSAPPKEWKLVWEEEFDQTGGFDTTVWTRSLVENRIVKIICPIIMD